MNHPANSTPGTDQTQKMIRLGVIGADRRGRIAQLAHDPDHGVALVAACSLKKEGIAGMADQFGPDFLITEDYRELLAKSDLDGVFICTPDHLHEEHAIAALRAGKHVYLEKPMAISIEGCDRILEAARESGQVLYPGHNMRFNPVMKQMADLVQAGAVGEVQAVWCRHFVSFGGDAYFRDWHSERQYVNGLLLQKGAHDIDMIHWFAGGLTRRVVAMGKLSVYDKLPRRNPSDPPASVKFNRSNWPPKSTSGYSPKIDVEDHSMILMELDNGVQASYMQCHYTPDDCRNYTIIGTEGRIENHGDHSTEEKWATIHIWNQRSGYQPMGHEVYRVPPMVGTHGGSDPAIVQDFLSTLRGEPARGATPWEARMATAAGCMATQSLRHGNQALEIPGPASAAQ